MKVYEGDIVSCDLENNVYKFLVEDEGKIVFVGDTLPDRFKGTFKEKLEGKALLPAFADTHIHFSSYSLFASTLDVRNVTCHEDICELILQYEKTHKEKIIIGFGASAHNVKEKTLITRPKLDSVVANKPLMLVKYDGHASIINSYLINELPENIKKLRGFNYETGEMNQEAFFAVTNYITNKLSPLTIVKNLLKGYDRLAEKGIGMMHTVEGVGFPRDFDVDMVRFFSRGQQNAFSTRIFFQTMDVKKALKRKLSRIGGCFATALDGCFGSEDAALILPYDNNSANKGVLYYDDKKVTDFAMEANRAGLQIELHAIGDRAFVQAVDALEAALKDSPRKDHRHTIIHACLPTEEGLEKVAKYDIGIALQPAFLDWALEPLEYVEKLLGKRTYEISPLRKMLDMGIHLSGGSDAPCTLPDPIEGIYNACNHYVREQSVSIPEALRMFTLEAARMIFDEKQRGSLEVGKIADMSILNKNPLSVRPKELRSLKVEKLILSGKDYEKNLTIGKAVLNGILGKNKIRK
ncbi:amidohydrolase [Clostridium sp. 19966]|uniref:amidohydrolase n=1 Tax=Clostridium sp. 19966 TaxID=2768166 RepID=UPI0028DE7C8A|nr:amidohydrolase [Clostridium sp. 19966]MDT8717687.1 amidohydrolase [Clostridium sp. 19966]